MKLRRAVHRRRRGYTLVEILAVIPALSITLGVAILTLGAMYKMDRQIRDSVDDQHQIQRFATQLRLDTHLAVSAATQDSTGSDAEPPELHIALDNGASVRYRSFPNRIDRLVYDKETVVHRETYRVTPKGTPPWSVDRDRSSPLITVDLQFPTRQDSSHVARKTVRLNATVRIVRQEIVSKT